MLLTLCGLLSLLLRQGNMQGISFLEVIIIRVKQGSVTRLIDKYICL